MERLTISFNVLLNGHEKAKTVATVRGLRFGVNCDEKVDHKNFTRNFHYYAQEVIDKVRTEYFDAFNDKNKMDGYIRTIYARPDVIGTLGSIRILLHVRKTETVILGFHKLTVGGKASLKTVAKTITSDINENMKKEESNFGNLLNITKHEIKYILENKYAPVLDEDEKLVKKALKDLESICDYLKDDLDKKTASTTKKTKNKAKPKKKAK